MSEPNFTPGPWYAHKPKESTGWYDITASNLYSDNIAMCFIMADGKVRANATLISAAPEMYQMLERILDYMTGGPFLVKPPNVEEIAHLLEVARGKR